MSAVFAIGLYALAIAIFSTVTAFVLRALCLIAWLSNSPGTRVGEGL